MWLCLLVKDVLQFSLLSVHLLKGKITDTRERDSHAGSFYYFFVKHESVGVGKKDPLLSFSTQKGLLGLYQSTRTGSDYISYLTVGDTFASYHALVSIFRPTLCHMTHHGRYPGGSLRRRTPYRSTVC